MPLRDVVSTISRTTFLRDVSLGLRRMLAPLRYVLDAPARGHLLRTGAALLALFALRAVLPLAAANQLRLIIDGLSRDNAAAAAGSTDLWWTLAAWGGLMIAANLLGSATSYVTDLQAQQLRRRVQEAVHRKAVALGLGWYDSSRFHDTLYRAQQDAGARLPGLVTSLLSVLSNGLSLVVVAGAFLTVQPVVLLVFALVPLPALIYLMTRVRQRHTWQIDLSLLERKLYYVHHLLSSRESAKEVRLLNLGPPLLARAAILWDRIAHHRVRLARSRLSADVLVNIVVVLAVVASAAFLARQAMLGVVTVGAVVMYLQWLQRGEAAFRAAQTSVMEVLHQRLDLEELSSFLQLESGLPEPAQPTPAPDAVLTGISMRDVSFQYPHSSRSALDHVSFDIPAGRTVALVGANGSGKTTLVKLLCRLYDPTEGAVLWDGMDIRACRAEDLRRRIAVAFQDFLKYELTVRENIWVGNVELDPDDPAIAEAARRSGADDLIARLPDGYDTILGRTRLGGEELSQGEWQLLALARAFVRECPLIILDEPTSALDADAEARVFEKFAQLTKGRTAVFVSHRFSTVRTADWIVVMRRGRVIEQGTHDDLIALNGTYARMFGLQAAHYR